MSAEESMSHIQELKRLAREGRNVPLLGGGIYLVWGFSILLGATVHASLLATELSSDWLAVWPIWVWAPAMTAGLAITFLLNLRVIADSRSGAVVNESVGFVWKIGGFACAVYFAATACFAPESVVMAPAVAAFVYATATSASSALARCSLLKSTAVGWVVFGGSYLVVEDGVIRLVLLSIAAALLLIVPGWVLLRREDKMARGEV